MVWEPQSCCGCGSVKTGAQILGWLAVICSTLNVLSQFRFFAVDTGDLRAECSQMGIQAVSEDSCVNFVYGTVITNILQGLVCVVVSILLLVGISKRKPSLMLPYLIFQMIGICLLGTIALVVVILIGVYLSIHFVFIFGAIFALWIFVQVYFFLVVRVCYKEVKAQNEAMQGRGAVVEDGTSAVPYYQTKNTYNMVQQDPVPSYEAATAGGYYSQNQNSYPMK